MSSDRGIAIGSVAALHAITRVMEERSAERYRELAEAFRVSCNQDTADAFAELAGIEDRHAAEFPAVASPETVASPWGDQDPEIADPDAVHYLMHPWHAFALALRHEQRALAFFETVAAGSSDDELRAAALDLVARERGHVELIRARLGQLPEPPEDWDEDPDPPNWDM